MQQGSGLSAFARRDDKMSRRRMTWFTRRENFKPTTAQRAIIKRSANAKRRRRDKRRRDET